MQVKINGKPEEISGGTVLDLLQAKRLNRKWLRSKSTTPCWTGIISPPPAYTTATGLSSCFIWEVAGDDDCCIKTLPNSSDGLPSSV